MSKKRNLLVIILLLLAIVGLSGYGAYSYFATEGSFDTEEASDDDADNLIRITGEFKPVVDEATSGGSGYENHYLGNGGSIYLTCPSTTTGHETITCSTTVTVRNEGTTDIYVEAEGLDAEAYVSDNDDITATASNPRFSWDNYTLSPNSSRTLTIYVDVAVGMDSNDDDTEVLVSGPVEDGSVSASVDFKLKATQAHE